MKRILVATDGSELAQAAIDAGVELAVARGLGSCSRTSYPSSTSRRKWAASRSHPNGSRTRENDPVLCDAVLRATGHGITTKTELLIGYPPKQILRLARDIDADLIVVGSRGLGPIKSAILGSTSREVLSHADQPVLVAAHAFTGSTINGSWSPMLFATSQITNQIHVRASIGSMFSSDFARTLRDVHWQRYQMRLWESRMVRRHRIRRTLGAYLSLRSSPRTNPRAA